ncbi:FHIPEP family type III secretion protein (plasmid) [Pontibacillus sp. ALD_SL1]|uniref:flagellar biosynthesis protein FlhA n=1 Tax=Pontibacillus sp. ALD_SL1 TaxID=2777185 RepID=UPI001A973A68|nr:flagellar biosynthesis protein FlhA [Pontibacillus sp. ALD_SL1]QST03051.1 FHIPEP family type III secretion protein [Pontibacillus sp. ALD_SL1]
MKPFLSQLTGNAKAPLSLMIMISFLVAIIVPLPPAIINLAVVFSLALAVTVFMTGTTIQEWHELKSFPTILLLAAIFRIALNVSTTRKILTDGEPGAVIEAAGGLIVGSSIWVGFVVFIVLIVVQFIVANGASRASEVNARFTLDGLPFKQLSIDNDVNNGAITTEEAKERRQKLDMEVDFYGNMDGAAKFIKGDVIAGIVLFLVNIIFGFIVGVAVEGMPVADAAYRYTLLTIGDGILNQLASLVLAVASAIVMTRVYSGEKENVTESIFKELTRTPLVMYVVGGMLLFLGVFTSMPILPFFIFGIIFIYIGYARSKKMKQEQEKEQKLNLEEQEEMQKQEENRIEVETGVEPIRLEFGVSLVPIVGASIGDKVIRMRASIAKELGVKIPKVHIIDNVSIPMTHYRIRIKETVVAEGEFKKDRLLAIELPYVIEKISGEPTKDPIFGEDALWIQEHQADQAKDNGYMVYDATQIMTHHLKEVIQAHLSELMTRQEIQDLVEQVTSKHPVLKKEIEKNEIKLSVVQGVVKNMLRETISIRDLPLILESIIDAYDQSSAITKDPNSFHLVDEISIYVRQKMASYLCEKAKGEDEHLNIILLDPSLEQTMQMFTNHEGYQFKLGLQEEKNLIEAVIDQVQRVQRASFNPVLLVSDSRARFALSRMLQRYKFQIHALSSEELALAPSYEVKRRGMVQAKAD